MRDGECVGGTVPGFGKRQVALRRWKSTPGARGRKRYGRGAGRRAGGASAHTGGRVGEGAKAASDGDMLASSIEGAVVGSERRLREQECDSRGCVA